MNFLDRLRRLTGRANGSEASSRGDEEASESVQPISCKEAMERLQEYLDGELEAPSHGEVAYHFSICQKCYPHLRLEERFRSLLHRSQEGEACPDEVKRQVLELLSAEGSDNG